MFFYLEGVPGECGGTECEKIENGPKDSFRSFYGQIYEEDKLTCFCTYFGI